MKHNNKLYVGQHSCFLLQYHLVLVTKFRQRVIIGSVKEDLVTYAKKFFAEYDCNILELNTDMDHIHILFEATPKICLPKLVGVFKSTSSRLLRNRHREFLSHYYWKPLFWSDSYFIATVSDRTEDTIRQYIQNQGKH